jgi:hypothetical protein
MSRHSVIIEGLLRGNGKITPCSVRATVVTSPDGTDRQYAGFEILLDSTGFSDVVYELEAGGTSEQVRPKLGTWVSAFPL